ncbi:MAG: thioredoxin family protein [Bacteroidetes bacterium]|nr:thioredoxin family protein [Bacteroidota bacterium]
MNQFRLRSFRLFFLAFAAACLLSFSVEKTTSALDFHLLNVNGKMVSLKDYPSARGFIVVFTCNHCPFAKLYPERMNQLNNRYKPLGVPLIAISSTDTIVYEEDGFKNMVAKATAEKFNFPYLMDGAQTVAKKFGAQKTPHAFVVWKIKGDFVVKYNGAIDDNGAEPEKAKIHYVANAVDALLKGKEVEIKETKSLGCQIHYRKQNQ